MDTLAEFRVEARAWLCQNANRISQTHDEVSWGQGSDSTAVILSRSPAEERAAQQAFIEWLNRKWVAGFGAIHYPVSEGGRGLTLEHSAVFAEEEAGFVIPTRDEVLGVTTLLAPNAILQFGSAELRARFLPMFLRADELCCQLFSEPQAGSDLASLQTSAARVGDDWVVNGQKLWSSGAHHAKWGLLLARTDPGSTRHHGLTMYLLPMDQNAVTVRQVRQMNGATSFCEVFLDGATARDSLRIGDVGDGWRVAMTTVAAERAHTGARRMGGTVEQVVALARHVGRVGDNDVRQKISDIHISRQLQEWNRARWAAGTLGPAVGSLSKLMVSRQLKLIGELATDLLGQKVIADTGEWGTYAWSEHVLGAPGYRVAGGTEEIQRNVAAERLLGLPREPRP
jgi:alkylation response protein AidB-like acyl-CoA dehydrogenase